MRLPGETQAQMSYTPSPQVAPYAPHVPAVGGLPSLCAPLGTGSLYAPPLPDCSDLQKRFPCFLRAPPTRSALWEEWTWEWLQHLKSDATEGTHGTLHVQTSEEGVALRGSVLLSPPERSCCIA